MIVANLDGAITRFEGDYFFLSNFFLADITYRGNAFLSTEHAYQASKTTNYNDFIRVQQADTPAEAKAIANRLARVHDWEDIKVDVMKKVITAKFIQHSALALMLANTEDRFLVEGNYWGDTFWGVCKGRGRNMLGQILMDVREKLKNE